MTSAALTRIASLDATAKHLIGTPSVVAKLDASATRPAGELDGRSPG